MVAEFLPFCQLPPDGCDYGPQLNRLVIGTLSALIGQKQQFGRDTRTLFDTPLDSGQPLQGFDRQALYRGILAQHLQLQGGVGQRVVYLMGDPCRQSADGPEFLRLGGTAQSLVNQGFAFIEE